MASFMSASLSFALARASPPEDLASHDWDASWKSLSPPVADGFVSACGTCEFARAGHLLAVSAFSVTRELAGSGPSAFAMTSSKRVFENGAHIVLWHRSAKRAQLIAVRRRKYCAGETAKEGDGRASVCPPLR